MLKITKEHYAPILMGLILVGVLLAATAKVSYYLGERYISELVLHSGVPDGKQTQTQAQPVDYAKTLDSLRAQQDRLASDYNSACYNYQVLYDAYDKLYTQAGAAAGHEKIVRPDSARGNEESCYR